MASPQQLDAPFTYAYQGAVITAGLLLPIVSIALTGLRFEARRQKRHPLGWDDFFIVFALVCLIGLGVDLTIGGVRGVFGKATPTYPSRDPKVIFTQLLPGQELIGKLQYIFWILITLCYGFTKLSVIFFYRRLFAQKRWFDYLTKGAIVISVAWTISFLFTHIFSCGSHPEYVWGTLEELLKCPSNLAYLEAFMISDFITDFLIFVMPFPLIARLQMPLQRKLAVSVILLLGAFSLAANAVRLAYQILVTKTGYAESSDRYLTLTLILYWSMIEAGVALIAINLPILQAFAGEGKIDSLFERMWSRISRSSARLSGPKRGAGNEASDFDGRAQTPGSGPMGHSTGAKKTQDSPASSNEKLNINTDAPQSPTDAVSPTDSQHFSYHAMMRET